MWTQRYTKKRSSSYSMEDDICEKLGLKFSLDFVIFFFSDFGRAPRSVLEKHYASQGLELLREICEKANLKVLWLQIKDK
jgi:hypothetical protein